MDRVPCRRKSHLPQCRSKYYAAAIYGLGEIECAKDTGDLLALAFIPRLNAALKCIIQYKRDNNGKLLSDGMLSIYKKAAEEGEREETSTFYAILDRTNRYVSLTHLS
jgi:hypothetical protein